MNDSHRPHDRQRRPRGSYNAGPEGFSDGRLVEVHNQLARDKEEPSEGFSLLPVCIVFLFCGFGFWAGLYLTRNSADFNPAAFDLDAPRAVADNGPKEFEPDPVKGEKLVDPDLKPLFSGDQIASCNVATDQGGARVVAFTLKDEGANLFATWTSDNIGSYFAIVLDGTVVSAPYIQSAITGGEGQISGGGAAGFPLAEATNLVTVLKFGSLPFPIAEIGVTEVKATLGASFLGQALFAGAVGILLVFLFMLLHYRLAGIVANAALVFYIIIVLAIFRLIPVTLTLAGVAGFVLSIGMAVDANILIFERSKEELRIGKGVGPAIEAGFVRAWNSILDSNVSSLITAFILFYFGSSTIKGFALVLIIGVLCSMFTAITVTRFILRAVIARRRFASPYLYGIAPGDLAGAAAAAEANHG